MRLLDQRDVLSRRAVKEPNTGRNLLNAREVAEYLQVPVSWIYDNYRAVGLPAIKLGKHLRFHPEELDQWLESCRRIR